MLQYSHTNLFCLQTLWNYYIEKNKNEFISPMLTLSEHLITTKT